MEPLIPSPAQFEVLFAIAREGFVYEAVKHLCFGAGWELVSDEPDVGFLQYFLWLGVFADDRRLLRVGTPEVKDGPFIYLPLSYYDERENGSSPGDRTPFDAAYQCLADVALETPF